MTLKIGEKRMWGGNAYALYYVTEDRRCLTARDDAGATIALYVSDWLASPLVEDEHDRWQTRIGEVRERHGAHWRLTDHGPELLTVVCVKPTSIFSLGCESDSDKDTWETCPLVSPATSRADVRLN